MLFVHMRIVFFAINHFGTSVTLCLGLGSATVLAKIVNLELVCGSSSEIASVSKATDPGLVSIECEFRQDVPCFDVLVQFF